MDFIEAEREQVYGQVAIIGPSGSGKTVGGLKLAYGLTGDWSKIGVVDTEHKRSKVYVGTEHTGGSQIGKFKHMHMEPPYTVDKYHEALKKAVAAGLEVVMFDSFSHEWEGQGGITDWANDLGGEFRHWKQPKLAHKKLIDEIMHAPIHVIVTIRTKQEYVVVPNGGKDGKSSVEKLGMKPVQSGDIDYEFLVAFTVDMGNNAVATKDNTGLYKGMNDLITENHGRMLKEWLIEGKEVDSVEDQNKAKEEKRQVLITKFTEMRKSHVNFQKYFTNLEVKSNNKLEYWPIELLENVDKDLEAKKAAAEAKKKQEQQPAPEEPKPQEEPKAPSGRQALIEEIKKLYEIPEVAKTLNEFLEKSKVDSIDSLRDEQVKFMCDLANTKAKFVRKGA